MNEITWSFLEESNCLKIFNFIGSLSKSKTVEFSQAKISFGHSPNIKFEMVACNKRDKHIPFFKISLLTLKLLQVTTTDSPLYNSIAITIRKLCVN